MRSSKTFKTTLLIIGCSICSMCVDETAFSIRWAENVDFDSAFKSIPLLTFAIIA